MVSAEIDALLSKPVIRPKDVPAVLPIALMAVYRAIERGDIESIRVGKKIMVPTAPLRRKLGM
jgi:hypothetical protein